MTVNFERTFERLDSAKSHLRWIERNVEMAAELPNAILGGVHFTIRTSEKRWRIAEWLGVGNAFVPKKAHILIARRRESTLAKTELTKIAKWIREIGYAKCEIVRDINDGLPVRDRRRSSNRTTTKRKARKK